MNDLKLCLLLADDDMDDCLFFKDALEELSAQTLLTMVHDGEQLLLYLKNEANPIPHILFLDLNMPRKNGFECLVDLKQIDRLKGLPVIIFSTSIEQKMLDLLYKNGAHYYIHKPPEFERLKRLIYMALTFTFKHLFTQELDTNSGLDVTEIKPMDLSLLEVEHPIDQPGRAFFVLSSPQLPA